MQPICYSLVALLLPSMTFFGREEGEIISSQTQKQRGKPRKQLVFSNSNERLAAFTHSVWKCLENYLTLSFLKQNSNQRFQILKTEVENNFREEESGKKMAKIGKYFLSKRHLPNLRIFHSNENFVGQFLNTLLAHFLFITKPEKREAKVGWFSDPFTIGYFCFLSSLFPSSSDALFFCVFAN